MPHAIPKMDIAIARSEYYRRLCGASYTLMFFLICRINNSHYNILVLINKNKMIHDL